LENIYNINQAKDRFEKLIGIVNTQKWISGFDRGHLAPNADFAFLSQQKATYYYLNASPQFHRFNSVGWFAVEKAVRRIAANNGKITVQTGTKRALFLNDENNNAVKAFLDDEKNIQVPLYFYKIISIGYRPMFAFIGFNAPNHRDFNKDLSTRCIQCPRNIFVPSSDPIDGIVTCCMYENPYQQKEVKENFGIELWRDVIYATH
jgi:hypothetical protein